MVSAREDEEARRCYRGSRTYLLDDIATIYCYSERTNLYRTELVDVELRTVWDCPRPASPQMGDTKTLSRRGPVGKITISAFCFLIVIPCCERVVSCLQVWF
jgi:hypothetical protein